MHHLGGPALADIKEGSGADLYINNPNTIYENNIAKVGIAGVEDYPQVYRLAASAFGVSDGMMDTALRDIESYKKVMASGALVSFAQVPSPENWENLQEQIGTLAIFLAFPKAWNLLATGREDGESDGLVKKTSQVYPNYNLQYYANGANHVEERSHDGVLLGLRNALQYYGLGLPFVLNVPLNYPTIAAAISAAIPGQTVNVTNGQTLSSNLTVPAGVTLSFCSGASVNFGNYYISRNGSITGTQNITCALLKTGSTLMAIGSINKLANLASLGQTVELQAKTYNENISFSGKNNLIIKGVGQSQSTINGTVTAYSCSTLTMNDFTCKGLIVNTCRYLLNLHHLTLNPNGGYSIGLAAFNSTGVFSGTILNAYLGYNPNNSTINIYNFDYNTNTYINNGGYGVYAANNSNVSLYRNGNPATLNICGNAIYELSAEDASVVNATNCSYSTIPPRTIGINVHAYGYNSCSGLTKINPISETNQSIEPGASDPVFNEFQNINAQFFNLLQDADEDFYLKGSYDKSKFINSSKELASSFRRFIEKNQNSELAKTALTTAVHCLSRFRDDEEVKTYLQEILGKKNLSNVNGFAKRFMIDYYCNFKDFTTALSIADEILKEKKADATLYANVLYAKGLILSHDLENSAQAAECFMSIVKNYPNNTLSNLAKNELNLLGIEVEENIKANSNAIENTKFSLSNYPNPFNPVTEITFSLPTDENVVIKVYDILGSEITTLVNEPKKAGDYFVKFDGSNLSSGIYFYSITAGRYYQTKKMILAK